MELFTAMVQSLGWLFGPLMLLAALVALVMCARATVRTDRPVARRALMWALLPPVLGVVGAIVGLVMWSVSQPGAPNQGPNWLALAYTVLFGAFVALVPALWALVLLRQRPPALA
jgi:hypothetical protein